MKWYHEKEHSVYNKKRFTLKKESHIGKKFNLKTFDFRMSLLRQKKFKKIKIPHFTYTINDPVITYEIEFIKGSQLKIENIPKYYDIIKSDLIFTGDDYGFTDFSLENFVVEVNTEDLYYVDFEDFGVSDDLIRKKMWDEYRQKDTKHFFWK